MCFYYFIHIFSISIVTMSVAPIATRVRGDSVRYCFSILQNYKKNRHLFPLTYLNFDFAMVNFDCDERKNLTFKSNNTQNLCFQNTHTCTYTRSMNQSMCFLFSLVLQIGFFFISHGMTFLSILFLFFSFTRQIKI